MANKEMKLAIIALSTDLATHMGRNQDPVIIQSRAGGNVREGMDPGSDQCACYLTKRNH